MTDQDREIICRAAAQDPAGVLRLVTAVLAGEIRPVMGRPLLKTSIPTPALDAVKGMTRQEQIEVMARNPELAKQIFRDSRRAARKQSRVSTGGGL